MQGAAGGHIEDRLSAEQEEGCRSILERLTPEQRRIAVLLMEGYSKAEAADMLGVSPKTVWAQVYRMRERLAKS